MLGGVGGSMARKNETRHRRRKRLGIELTGSTTAHLENPEERQRALRRSSVAALFIES